MGPQYKGHLRQFLVSLQPQETHLWAASLEVHLCDHLDKPNFYWCLTSPLRRNLELISPSPDLIRGYPGF